MVIVQTEEGRKGKRRTGSKGALSLSLELVSRCRKWRHKATRPERGEEAFNGQMGIGAGTKLALLFLLSRLFFLIGFLDAFRDCRLTKVRHTTYDVR